MQLTVSFVVCGCSLFLDLRTAGVSCYYKPVLSLPQRQKVLSSIMTACVFKTNAVFAPVAQLDRALACGAKGHRFESCRVYHIDNTLPVLGSFLFGTELLIKTYKIPCNMQGSFVIDEVIRLLRVGLVQLAAQQLFVARPALSLWQPSLVRPFAAALFAFVHVLSGAGF